MAPFVGDDTDRVRVLTFLDHIVRALASDHDTSEVMRSIVDETTEVTGTQVCSLYIWDPGEQNLTLTATNGLPHEAVGTLKLARGEGVTGWVAEHQKPAAVSDVRQEPRFFWIPGVDHEQYLSMLSVPVVLGGRLLGVLNVQKSEQHTFTEYEIDFLLMIASQLAGIIEISGLNRQIELVRALQASEDRFRRIVETAAEGILICDASGLILYVNLRLCQMLGYRADEVCGHTIESFRDGEALADLSHLVLGHHWSPSERRDSRVVCRDGEQKWVMVSANPVLDGDGNRGETIIMLTDITERKEAEEALKHQALHDHLTGLPNRILLSDRLEQALQTARRTNSSVSLLLFDLDRFKDVNDTLGHAAGDDLLQKIGRRIRQILRKSDTIARLGGDEFVALLPTVSVHGAGIVAGKILAALNKSFIIDGRPLYIGASIGLVSYPDHGLDSSTLLRRADVAMYSAKRDRGTFRVFSESMDEGRSLGD